ncbi:MAG TPA: hypothetical protein VIY86_13755, partial [Pirellulaceae bacterium]
AVMRTSLWLCCLVVIPLGIGCSRGPRLYPVAGKVQFKDGTPVSFGRLECLADANRAVSRAEIGRDGSFRLGTHKPGDGAVAGRHAVILLQTVVTPSKETSHRAHGRMVSRHYGRYESSGLILNVDPEGRNDAVVIRLAE